jgi:hypothetical protein
MSLKFEPSEYVLSSTRYDMISRCRDVDSIFRAQMESCRQQFLQEGGKALAKWGGAATVFTSVMSLCTHP